MRLTPQQVIALMSPLASDRVEVIKGASYLQAFDVKAMLIRVFGFAGFSVEIRDAKVVEIMRDVPRSGGGTVNFRVVAQATCVLTIHDPDHIQDAVYTETVAAEQSGAQLGEVLDFALKTVASDSLKRCAAYLGTQFGLGLYDNGKTSEVVRRVFAPGQTVDDIAAAKTTIGQVPGAPEAGVDTSKAQAAIARALPGRPAETVVGATEEKHPELHGASVDPRSVEAAAARAPRTRRPSAREQAEDQGVTDAELNGAR